MPTERDEPGGATTTGPSNEAYELLAGVMEDQAQKAQARKTAPVPGRRPAGPLAKVALALLTILSAYLWIFPPGWIARPVAPPQSPRLLEAGMRMEIYIQASAVDEFREREGRLPNSLGETGDPFSAVVYERLNSNHYRMTMDGPDGEIRYLSTDSLTAFLGDAAQVIREGG